MKLVTLICLLLCTLVTESRHLQKRDVEHHSRHLGGIYLAVGKQNFDYLVLVMLTQDFQKCSLKEHLEMVADISATAQHCADHEAEEKCQKPMTTLYYDKCCHIPNLKDEYPWTVECCAKVDPEREKCFHDHRDVAVEPYQRPDAGDACTQHKEHPVQAFKTYTYNIARRHSSIHPPAVLALARQYHAVITECCDVEETEKCFEPKFIEIVKATQKIEYMIKQDCHILSTFPERASLAKRLTKFAQKYPNGNHDVINKLTFESVHWSKDCCKGDVVECMVERMELTQHACDNKEKISPNLNTCCDKPLLERTPCIMNLPNDAVPEGLPDESIEFVEDKEVCKHFTEEKDKFLSKFLFEFARRRPDVSGLSCMRVAKGYGVLLTKCCATENPAECYKDAPQLLEAGIKEAKDLAKANCDLYKKLGDKGYMIALLKRYVQKMPQVSDATLLEITGKMTKVAGKCCALPESQLMSCGEEKLDFLLGEMCEKQKVTFINDQVRHCCTDSYAGRRPCFTKLEVDPSYVPPAFDESAFHVDASMCEGTEEEQVKKRLPLLIQILKLKPDLSDEKMNDCIGEFTKVRETCCAEKNHQSCFDTKKADVLKHVKETMEH